MLRPRAKPMQPGGGRTMPGVYLLVRSETIKGPARGHVAIWLFLLCGRETHSALSGSFGFVDFHHVRPHLQAHECWVGET